MHFLQIISSNQKHSVSITVTILDANDNYPAFPDLTLLNPNYFAKSEEPVYEMLVNVDENTKINTRVARLQAVDADKERSIKYKIVHANTDADATYNNKLLSVDSSTGMLADTELIDFISLNKIKLFI